MALVPLFVTGWEHGVNPSSTTGGGLASGISGTPTVDAAAKRSGNYGLLVNPSGTTEAVAYTTATTGIRKSAARFYVRFSSAVPSVDIDLFAVRSSAGGAQVGWIWFRTSDDRFLVEVAGGTATVVGPNPVVADTWYRIDFQLDSSTTTGVVRGRVDGGAEATCSKSSFTAVDQRQWEIGYAAGTATYVAHYDDLIFGTYTVDSEYWGGGKVIGLSPNADGTHSNATAGLAKASGGTTDTYAALNSVPIGNATNYVLQANNATTEYLEVTLPDLTESPASVNGAHAMLAYGVSATAHTGAVQVVNAAGSVHAEVGSATTTTDINQRGTAGTAWAMATTSGAIWYKGAQIPAGTSASTDYGALTPTIVNAFRVRVGYAGDAAPDPHFVDVMIEVDYPVSTGTANEQSLAGTVTSSSTKANLSVKSRGGTGTPHGAKANLSIKSRGGTSTSAGVLTRRQILAPFAGAIASSATLKRLTAKPRGGTATPHAAVSKLVRLSRAGTATSGGALRRATIKAFAGSATPSGALGMASVKLVALAGSIGSSAALVRLARRKFTGTGTSSATLKRASARHFAGTGTSAGTVKRKGIKAFAGSSSPTALLRRLGIKAFGGTITSSAEATNAEGAPNIYYLDLEGAIGYAPGWDDENWDEPGFTWDLAGFSGALTLNQGLSQALGGLMNPAAGLRKAAGLHKAGTVSSAGGLTSIEGKGFGGTITPHAATAKLVVKRFAGSAHPSASFRRTAIKAFAGSVSPGASMSFGSVVIRAFAGTISPAGDLSNVANNSPRRGRIEVELVPKGTISVWFEQKGMIA